jgi:hypothetical protein
MSADRQEGVPVLFIQHEDPDDPAHDKGDPFGMTRHRFPAAG